MLTDTRILRWEKNLQTNTDGEKHRIDRINGRSGESCREVHHRGVIGGGKLIDAEHM